MCRVEYYTVRYPDGFLERKERIVHCRRGTPSSPCSNLEYDRDTFVERPATNEEIQARTEPWLRTIAPTPQSSSRSADTSDAAKPESKWRKLFGLRKKPRLDRKSGEQRSSPARESPARPEARDRQRRPHREVKVHNPAREGERSSSSARAERISRDGESSSERDPEPDRARLREEERQKQREKFAKEHKEKVAMEEAAALDRAQKLHAEEDAEQQHQQDIAWARTEGKRRKNGRPPSYHAIRDEPMTDEQLQEQQRQYERDQERIREFDRRSAAHQAEEDRRTQEETDSRRARRQEREEERYAWRRQQDESRRRRQREAGIPRQPHHPSIIHDIRNYDTNEFEQQGSEYIQSAARAEAQRRAERRAPPSSWNLPVRGSDGLMRRNTIDGSQREERNGRRRNGHKRGGPSY